MEVLTQVSVKDLRGADVFNGISDDGLEKIAKLCKQHAYEAGEYCAVQGEKVSQLLIVNGGKFASEMKIGAAPYTYTVTIATLTKGRVGAWSAVVPPHVLTGSLKCIDGGPVISMPASDLQRIFEEDPTIERVVMKNLAFIIGSRLRDSHAQLERLIAEVIKQGKPENRGG